MRILLVEDELEMAVALKSGLERHGLLVDVAHSLQNAQAALAGQVHDLLLIDRRLPDGDGISLIAKARATRPDLPIIAITGRDSIRDRVYGLDQGADDYLIKPFALEELLARIRAIGRRPSQVVIPEVQVSNLYYDFSAREARVDGIKLDLPRRQLLVLETLCLRASRTVTREWMLEKIYGFDDSIQPSTLDTHVSKLRKALDGAGACVKIHVIRGVGYLLKESDNE